VERASSAVPPGSHGTLIGGSKHNLSKGARTGREASTRATSDGTQEDLLAGLPNIRKVPTVQEWVNWLSDEVSGVTSLEEGSPHHPEERHLGGSHMSAVTSPGDPQGEHTGMRQVQEDTRGPPHPLFELLTDPGKDPMDHTLLCPPFWSKGVQHCTMYIIQCGTWSNRYIVSDMQKDAY
jgi:hypothetical protein